MVGCASSLCETLWELKAVKVTCVSRITAVVSVATGPCMFADLAGELRCIMYPLSFTGALYLGPLNSTCVHL